MTLQYLFIPVISQKNREGVSGLNFRFHSFKPLFIAIPPLIYFPSSALILKSPCSTALMCLVFAESASNTSWADTDMESKNLQFWPLPRLLQCCCVTVPGFHSYVCLLSLGNRLSVSVLRSLYVDVISGHLHWKLWRCEVVPGNQRSTCLLL